MLLSQMFSLYPNLTLSFGIRYCFLIYLIINGPEVLYFARCGKHNISFGETKVLGILPHLKFYFTSILGMLEKFLVLGEGRTCVVWISSKLWSGTTYVRMGILEAIV